MNITEVLTILAISAFIVETIIMIIQIINTSVLTLANLLAIVGSIPCYEVRVYRNGKRLKYEAWITYANNSVKYYELKDSVLYITIS